MRASPSPLHLLARVLADTRLRSAFMWGCVLLNSGCLPVRPPLEYFLPNDYRGWVSIRCSLPDEAPLREADGRFQITVPPDGRFRTSSNCEAGVREVRYWYVDGSKRRVRELTVDQSDGVSRLTAVGPKQGRSELGGFVFWVGPLSDPGQVDASFDALVRAEFAGESGKP